MIEDAIKRALYDRAATLPFPSGVPVFYPNDKEKPPNQGPPYVEVRQLENKTSRFLMRGSDPSIFKGILQILIHYPLGDGDVDVLGLSNIVLEHFKSDNILWKDGVRVNITERPSVGSGLPTQVSWEVPVSVSYEAFA